jgi:hypothetical protein
MGIEKPLGFRFGVLLTYYIFVVGFDSNDRVKK